MLGRKISFPHTDTLQDQEGCGGQIQAKGSTALLALCMLSVVVHPPQPFIIGAHTIDVKLFIYHKNTAEMSRKINIITDVGAISALKERVGKARIEASIEPSPQIVGANWGLVNTKLICGDRSISIERAHLLLYSNHGLNKSEAPSVSALLCEVHRQTPWASRNRGQPSHMNIPVLRFRS